MFSRAPRVPPGHCTNGGGARATSIGSAESSASVLIFLLLLVLGDLHTYTIARKIFFSGRCFICSQLGSITARIGCHPLLETPVVSGSVSGSCCGFTRVKFAWWRPIFVTCFFLERGEGTKTGMGNGVRFVGFALCQPLALLSTPTWLADALSPTARSLPYCLRPPS